MWSLLKWFVKNILEDLSCLVQNSDLNLIQHHNEIMFHHVVESKHHELALHKRGDQFPSNALISEEMLDKVHTLFAENWAL